MRRTSTALAQAKGAIERAVPEVLFVCEKNTVRSQSAAVRTNALSDGAAHVGSAGSTPAYELNLLVTAATGELGLDHHDGLRGCMPRLSG